MKLSIQELNEIIYALGVADYKGMFVNKEVNISAGDKVRNELERLIKEEESPRRSTPHTEFSKAVEQATTNITKVITPITDTGSEVADFLIAVTAELPVKEETTEEVVEIVKKAKFPGAKKSNLINPEK
jgi:hypothetical protein